MRDGVATGIVGRMSKIWARHRLTRRAPLWIAGLVVALLALAYGGELFEETLAGEWAGPAQAVDGDTLVVAGARLRLIAIDAPERGQNCRDAAGRDYACGEAAARELAALIAGDDVACSGRRRDRFRRPLVVCFRGERDLNAEMVRAGWAVAYLDRRYQLQEAEARAARRGLWHGSFQRPEEWRRAHGK